MFLTFITYDHVAHNNGGLNDVHGVYETQEQALNEWKDKPLPNGASIRYIHILDTAEGIGFFYKNGTMTHVMMYSNMIEKQDACPY